MKRSRTFPGKVKGLKSPTQLPENESSGREWQELNRAWWERAPMRYDWTEAIQAEWGSAAYFEEIDRRFFQSVHQYLPWHKRPFDNLIDFTGLKDQDVLEIGVGCGSHAQLIAPFCKSFTGIDLTENARRETTKRLESFGIPGRIVCMDAEKMSFPDVSFDFIWSWGVLHHSANPFKILREMHRVLRPDGQVTVMVYHRSFWKYYVMDGFIRGILSGELFRKGSFLRVNQAATDGALARYYRPEEWRRLCTGLFDVESSFVTGQKSDLILLPRGPLKRSVEAFLPDGLTRFFTNRLRFGSFLIVKMRRNDSAYAG